MFCRSKRSKRLILAANWPPFKVVCPCCGANITKTKRCRKCFQNETELTIEWLLQGLELFKPEIVGRWCEKRTGLFPMFEDCVASRNERFIGSPFSCRASSFDLLVSDAYGLPVCGISVNSFYPSRGLNIISINTRDMTICKADCGCSKCNVKPISTSALLMALKWINPAYWCLLKWHSNTRRIPCRWAWSRCNNCSNIESAVPTADVPCFPRRSPFLCECGLRCRLMPTEKHQMVRTDCCSLCVPFAGCVGCFSTVAFGCLNVVSVDQARRVCPAPWMIDFESKFFFVCKTCEYKLL